MITAFADIKLVIADDHELFRDGLKLMLAKYPELHIVGEAQNGKELIDLVVEHNPDVVLTDIKMPVMNGIEAAKKISSFNKDISIISLSMFDEDDLIVDMLEAGAKGYLLKNSDKQEILDAIQTVYKGHYFYGKSTTSRLTHLIAKSKFNPFNKSLKPEFTERELQIIDYICHEYSNKQIAEKMFLSVRTIEANRQRIIEKMNVTNTAGLVFYALKNKLVSF